MLGQLTQVTAASTQRVDAVSPPPAATGNGRFADHLVDARRRSDHAPGDASAGRQSPKADTRGNALPGRGQQSPQQGRQASLPSTQNARVDRASDSAHQKTRTVSADHPDAVANQTERSAARRQSAQSSDKAALPALTEKVARDRELPDLLEASDTEALLAALADWQGGELPEDVVDTLLDENAAGPVMALADDTWLAATEDGAGLLLTLNDQATAGAEVTVETVSLDTLSAHDASSEALSLLQANSDLDLEDISDMMSAIMQTLQRVQQADPETDAMPEDWERALANLIRPIAHESDQTTEFAEWSALADTGDSGVALSLSDWLAGDQSGVDADDIADVEDINDEAAVAPGTITADAAADSDSDDLEVDDIDQSKSRRDRAGLTESLLTRLVSDGGRAQAAEDSSTPLRMSMEPGAARELTRQTTLDMAREHVERQIPVKNSAGELTQRLSERLVVMIGQDIQEARIRLDPPELGRMDVKVTTQNDQVQVQVIAQQPMVRDLLEQHAHRLRDMLEQQGFTSVDVDVSDQPWQDGQDGEQGEAGGQGGAAADGEDADLVAENERVGAVALGLVDHYV